MICRNCKKEFPKWIIVNGKKRNLSSRKNCTNCSPFGLGKTIKYKYIGPCFICGIENKKMKGRYCSGCITKIRRFRIKQKAIEICGGKCHKCGISGNQAIFDFHHIIGNKEFVISRCANKKWEIIENEIKKCILLCANCHRLEHNDKENPKLIVAVNNYSGRNLKCGDLDFIFPNNIKELVLKFPLSHIAKNLGCSVSRISNYCRKNNIPRPINKNWNKEQGFCKTKIEWPDKNVLNDLLWKIPTKQIAKQLGVSDKAVEKHIKKLGLTKPPRGYWSKHRTLTRYFL
jgi:hypothetical protein